MGPQQQAGWVVAIGAGLLSFVSPCVLPLIPGYLSLISGVSLKQLEERRSRHLVRVFVSCLLFSVGFSVVFILVGLGVGTIGRWLDRYRFTVNIVFGAMVVLFGLFVAGLLRLPFLYQERRLRVNTEKLGMWGAPLLGFAFGFGWTPCIGPWLTMLIAEASRLPATKSALLFGLFSASLATCFIVAGLLFASALRAFAFLQRNHRVVEAISGSILIAIGVLMVTQRWDRAIAAMNRWLSPVAAAFERLRPGGL